MARGDQLSRQWKIIQTLISSRMGKSAADLAEALGCHPRTLYRDLEALQAAGFPIYTERVEGKNLWSLLDTVKHQIPIPFSLPELMALYFSTDMLRVFKDTVFYDSLESLSQKVKTTLPPESLKYVKNVEQTLHLGMKPYKQYSRFKEIINRVNDAAINKKSIEMVYYTMSRKQESGRKVDPYKIWFLNGTFYLIGHCHVRNEVRIFALDRIKMLHQTKDAFEIPGDFSFEAYTNFRDFKAFHFEQAIAFKKHFAEQRGHQSGEKLSKATLYSTLTQLKRFFQWLAWQPGYKSRVQYADAEYFNLSEKDTRIATAKRQQRCPTLEQIKYVLNTMPSGVLADAPFGCRPGSSDRGQHGPVDAL
jgi:predicted DNA-binding transcriptional regulator YafY